MAANEKLDIEITAESILIATASNINNPGSLTAKMIDLHIEQAFALAEAFHAFKKKRK